MYCPECKTSNKKTANFCRNCGVKLHAELTCPNCNLSDVEDDGSDFLQYSCNVCGYNWGYDGTVCPNCESDEVVNKDIPPLQYCCNKCGHKWDDEDDEEDGTDNEAAQESINTIVQSQNQTSNDSDGCLWISIIIIVIAFIIAFC